MLQKKYIFFKNYDGEPEKWQDFSRTVQDIKATFDSIGGSSLYIHLICYSLDHELLDKVQKCIHSVLPQAVLTGISEIIFFQKTKNSYMVMSVNYFQQAKIKLLTYDECSKDDVTWSSNVSKEIAACPDAKAVGVYCSCMNPEFIHFFNRLTKENDHLLFFGSATNVFKNITDIPTNQKNLALLNLKDYHKPFVIGNQLYNHGIVMVIFYGSELDVHGDYVLGWKPLGKALTITKTAAINCITKLNDMPATEIYHHYLNVLPDDNFVFNIAEFPLAVERNGCLIAWVPIGHDDQKRLYFNGDVYDGETIRLTYGVHNEMIQETARISRRMCSFAPDGIFLSVCSSRVLFLQELANKELDYYREFAPELVSNYGSAEIYHHQGKGGILNCALISVGFREGPIKNPDSCNIPVQTMDTYNIIPLANRMATFLDAMAQELTQSNEELKIMAKTADAANQAKSDFLSNMSHEIRTPINAILGMDEMILREATDPTILEYAQNIASAGNTLLNLINDVLDFSKIEAGKLEILPTEYAPSSLLNDLVNMISLRAAKKNLAFNVDAAPDLPCMLVGDELRIRQIITNLLTNAVKYTPEGTVTLTIKWEKLTDKDISLKVAVTDTGIGIKKEDISKLFEAFKRIEEERNRTIEGTGLGINISQRLLNMMGSTLEVDSTYGEGSCFYFTVKQQVINWAPMGDYNEAYHQSQANASHNQQTFIAPDANILVVDDTEMNLTVIKGLLKRTKIQVDTAVSGYECLKLTQKKSYDLIFLDHRMPGMDGIETLNELKKFNDSPNIHTPIVALTANAVAGAAEMYIQAGFDAYMTKPIDSRKLDQCLMDYLPESKVLTQVEALEETPDTNIQLPKWLISVPGLDTAAGIKHCGSVNAYLDALRVFAESLPSTSREIQRFFEAKDCLNYTTKVHALKSTARVAGCTELSEKARRLEDAGNNKYLDELTTDTPILLSLCQNYINALKPLIQKDTATEEEKIPISDEELTEAWQTLEEIIQSFDYDSLTYMLQELNGYALSKDDSDKLNALQEAAKLPDWTELKKILGH
ncbi:MAG: response regulator [Anaerovibrio sp.]|uniref:ATP-binding protein n=1 Tax=Anaerovibrio sp. TaxID=1872532 RepID=UPI0025E9D06D|nr:ATP-binding protein [Anaerovibrio sp.]MCR5177115.1 response regulator [Anaerovibrio sp.]